jgi:addiction module RelE/StbE family toxin
MVRLSWTEIAIRDLEEIFDFIARDSTRYASITVNKIYQRVQDIKDSPMAGRMVPEFQSTNLREFIYRNYRIVYQIIETDRVDILRIFHTSRLLQNTTL